MPNGDIETPFACKVQHRTQTQRRGLLVKHCKAQAEERHREEEANIVA
jgi:hypothetical protein